jgi:hypothetical protein
MHETAGPGALERFRLDARNRSAWMDHSLGVSSPTEITSAQRFVNANHSLPTPLFCTEKISLPDFFFV